MHDTLGNRMKRNYEDRTRYFLPRRTYTILRIDGKAFHTFTKDFETPYSERLANAMHEAAKGLCKQAMSIKFAYIQSDEASFLLTDFDSLNREAWFDGNIQKLTSVSSSIFTAYFNDYLMPDTNTLAFFDSRVFTIPEMSEVLNYFIWRQQDCTRNSIQSYARTFFSHKELHNRNNAQIQDMLHAIGKNWNDCDPDFKRGRMIVPKVQSEEIIIPATAGQAGDVTKTINKTYWTKETPPVFTQDRNYLVNLIQK